MEALGLLSKLAFLVEAVDIANVIPGKDGFRKLDTLLEYIQIGLDGLGTIDQGELLGLPDLTNAIIYAVDAEWRDVAISIVSMMPVGDIVKLLRQRHQSSSLNT